MQGSLDGELEKSKCFEAHRDIARGLFSENTKLEPVFIYFMERRKQ